MIASSAMTNADVSTWEPRLRAMARRFWRQRAFGDPETLIDDLVQVGFLAVVIYGPAHPHAFTRAAFDMRTFLDAWLYGIPPGTARQSRTSGLVHPESLASRDLTERTPCPEDVALDRALIRQVTGHLPTIAHRILLALYDRYPARLSPGDLPYSKQTVMRYRRLMTQTALAFLGHGQLPRFNHGTSRRTQRRRRRLERAHA